MAAGTVEDMAMAVDKGMAADMLSGRSAEDCMAETSTVVDSDIGTEGSRSGSMGSPECVGRRSWVLS
jgi:hypothetical protein